MVYAKRGGAWISRRPVLMVTIGAVVIALAGCSGGADGPVNDKISTLDCPVSGDPLAREVGAAASPSNQPPSASANTRTSPLATATTKLPPMAAPSPDAVVDGQPIRVGVAGGPTFVVGEEPWGARRVVSADPTWELNVLSLSWLPPLYARALRGGHTEAANRLVDVIPRFYQENPDAGTNEHGWDEGTSLRRLESVLRIYQLHPDKQLVDAMEREATVLLGDRYYGPPRHPVHNHGLMANVRLIRAGQAIGRQDWVSSARHRIAQELPQAFSPAGLTLEQSSGYQIVNRNMWAGAGRELRALDPADPVLEQIKETVARASAASSWLTEPDGDIVQIGDAQRRAGVPSPCPGSRQRFIRDDVAGYVIGRWSHDDPMTTYYTMRYGPERRSHGHRDQGSVTWSAAGVRILVGTGVYGYNPRDMRVRYGRSILAANTASPAGGASEGPGFRVTYQNVTPDTHTWTLEGEPNNTFQRRVVEVNNHRLTLRVTDTLGSPDSAPLWQRWQLDPRWRIAGRETGSTLRFEDANHNKLSVQISGGTGHILKGSTDPMGGWIFPVAGQQQAAPQVVIDGSGAVTTTFTLTPPRRG